MQTLVRVTASFTCCVPPLGGGRKLILFNSLCDRIVATGFEVVILFFFIKMESGRNGVSFTVSITTQASEGGTLLY